MRRRNRKRKKLRRRGKRKEGRKERERQEGLGRKERKETYSVKTGFYETSISNIIDAGKKTEKK